MKLTEATKQHLPPHRVRLFENTPTLQSLVAFLLSEYSSQEERESLTHTALDIVLAIKLSEKEEK